ncbi:endolytic transglycosylase MltG [Sandarakinorhabdus sp. AAP62]|uniref:endolytic transglycosylase MltG n=1 Tax=Sandarakinorhabdus sp. AAP62 TaxID=1248916 RepID=UPI00031AF90D|nr:endolytic transglycosylase MltG [Sandarakinorhabdus sp. AAP62]
MRRAFLAFVALLLLGVAIMLIPWFGWGNVSGPAQSFEVKRGASLSGVARDLETAGLAKSAWQFRVLARVLGDDAPVQAGRYRLRAGTPWRDILATLQKGEVERFTVTIPEGWPAVLVAERLNAVSGLTGKASVPAEGSILPDTYEYQPGEDRAVLMKRMQTAMIKTLADLWPKRTARAVVKTPEQAIVLASIVEKETGKASERRMIAGVYSNRLAQGMKLDADPTVIYPITAGKPLGRRIRQSELRRDTGYNTYLKPGLPRGPIANPGRDSIMAVLDPDDTQALYFVADGSGGHVFAKTLAEHNANVARWFALRRQRGEM